MKGNELIGMCENIWVKVMEELDFKMDEERKK